MVAQDQRQLGDHHVGLFVAQVALRVDQLGIEDVLLGMLG